MPADHKAADGDPSSLPTSSLTYAAHYCAIPREVDPEIAACSFINSGLRIFNIQDPLHPREVAYFVSPPKSSDGKSAASDFAMSMPSFDPATREVWYTDATTGLYALKLDPSVWPDPTKIPAIARCLLASGRLQGSTLGPIALGRPRGAVRAQLPTFSTRGRKAMDFYCLTGGGGIRAGYPSPSLLRAAPRGLRSRIAGHVVLLLSANHRYAFGGARHGTRLSAVAKRLQIGRGYRVGLNTWYVAPGKSANGVFKVRHGVIQEVGIANHRLTASRRLARKFFASFD
jgi:hypothetical protein